MDESACDRRTYLRNRAWALEGLRACRKQYFARGKRYFSVIRKGSAIHSYRRYSILPGISLNGILECVIVEGSFNTELFTLFIGELLKKMQPFPATNSVIVMDIIL